MRRSFYEKITVHFRNRSKNFTYKTKKEVLSAAGEVKIDQLAQEKTAFKVSDDGQSKTKNINSCPNVPLWGKSMMKEFLGLEIARSIPPEVLTGLISGQYKMYGGVIRWATGTENAGQIVRHLLPVARELGSASLFSPISGALGAVNTY